MCRRAWAPALLCLSLALLARLGGGALIDDLPRELLLESLVQRERQVSTLEAQLATAREEISRLHSAMNALAGGDAGGPEQERLLNSATKSLRAEVRRFITRASRDPADDDGDEPAWASPQHVSVMCAGEVNIQSRPLGRDDRGGGECLVFDVSAGDLNARFALFCDDEGEGGGGGSDHGRGGGGRGGGEREEAEVEVDGDVGGL